MRIGIIGSGHIGGALGKLLGQAGHDIRHGTRSQAGSVVQAIAHGEAVIFAGYFGGWPEFARDQGTALAGKALIDASNPYPERDGAIAEAALAKGSALAVAGYLPHTRLAKTFNTLFWKDLVDQSGKGFGMALAADDPAALDTAAELVRDAGYEPVIAGGLAAASSFDPGRPAYAKLLSPQHLREALAQPSSELAS